jgi:CBS-domain-containing membrane protein
MKIKDVIKRDVLTVKADDSLKKAMIIICRNKISGLPVVDDDNKLIGIISEKDILKAMYLSPQEYIEYGATAFNEDRYKDIMDDKVESVMSTTLTTATIDDDALKVASLMILKKVRRIPIVDNEGKVIDLVSQGDIHVAIFKKYLED